MTNKVMLPREVAEAIEIMRAEGSSNFNILKQAQGAVVREVYLVLRKWAFDEGREGTPDLLMQALVNGYTVERTPEDGVRKFYLRMKLESMRNEDYDGQLYAVEKTLDLLGIKIEGVNA